MKYEHFLSLIHIFEIKPFRHNPKSKLTEKILASPNTGVCRRCYDKIEWRKQYRKYKPLTQPSKCNICMNRNITAAYHTICKGCSRSERGFNKMKSLTVAGSDANENGDTQEETYSDDFVVCAMCCKDRALPEDGEGSGVDQEVDDLIAKMEEKLGRPLKLRESKAIERKVERTREREKQAAKEERRRLREEAEAAKTEANAEKEENKINEQEEEHDVNIQEKDLMPDENDSDEEDPFLKAIGARDISSLTGEAYQKYLLSKESK